MTKFINTRASLRKNPNVNSQGQIDEDGEGEEAGTDNSNVNAAPAIETDEEDDSPCIHSLTVQHTGKLTDIVARVATTNGAINKRHVVPGHLTVKKLAAALSNVANW